MVTCIPLPRSLTLIVESRVRGTCNRGLFDRRRSDSAGRAFGLQTAKIFWAQVPFGLWTLGDPYNGVSPLSPVYTGVESTVR